MSNDLKVPKEKRKNYAIPLGDLISGKRSETIPKVIEFVKAFSEQKIKIHIVGDIVAQDFLSHPYLKQYIITCIIDEQTQRTKIDLFSTEFFDKIIEFENPAGTIQKHAWEAIKSALHSNKRTLIRITEGEEDLLVLPLISEIALKEDELNLVFYGQPPVTDLEPPIPEGIVIVKIDKKIKRIVNRFLKLMEKV